MDALLNNVVGLALYIAILLMIMGIFGSVAAGVFGQKVGYDWAFRLFTRCLRALVRAIIRRLRR